MSTIGEAIDRQTTVGVPTIRADRFSQYMSDVALHPDVVEYYDEIGWVLAPIPLLLRPSVNGVEALKDGTIVRTKLASKVHEAGQFHAKSEDIQRRMRVRLTNKEGVHYHYFFHWEEPVVRNGRVTNQRWDGGAYLEWTQQMVAAGNVERPSADAIAKKIRENEQFAEQRATNATNPAKQRAADAFAAKIERMREAADRVGDTYRAAPKASKPGRPKAPPQSEVDTWVAAAGDAVPGIAQGLKIPDPTKVGASRRADFIAALQTAVIAAATSKAAK